MAEYTRFINDAQWELLEPLLPKPKPNPKGGHPPAENREVLEGSFASAKKGVPTSAKPIKRTKWMVVVDGQGIALGSTLASASLAEKTLEAVKVPRSGRGRPKKRPVRLIADKAYDSDPLRERLKVLKNDLIVPHRSNRKRAKVQDGRKLRRYRKRWKVESGVKVRGAGGKSRLDPTRDPTRMARNFERPCSYPVADDKIANIPGCRKI